MTTSIPPGSIDDRSDVVITSPTNGQVLKYNGTNWVNAAESGGGSGDLVLLGSATASSSASVEFTSLIDNTYENYVVLFRAEVATDNVNFSMRTSSNNGSSYDSGASDYSFSSITSAGNQTSGNRSDIIFNFTGVGNASGEAVSGVVYIASPSQSKQCQVFGETRYTSHTPSPVTVMFGAARLSTSPVNAIQFFASSGNIATGTFKLYGIT